MVKTNNPIAVTVAAGAISDLARSRTDLLVENAMLRQQLIVLNRQFKQPQLTSADLCDPRSPVKGCTRI